jgi:beta-lactamase superfamily II metal-dependent hydrolase
MPSGTPTGNVSPGTNPQPTDYPDSTPEPSQQESVTGNLVIAFLDVGQGDSTFIMLPNGETLLIDAGEYFAGNGIIQFITENSGGSTINYVVATHPHSDHIGGMSDIIGFFDIENLWMPDAVNNTKTFETLLDAVDSKGLSVQIAKAGEVLFDYGNLKAEFIAPCSDGYANLNNYSAVILLTYNNNRFLFMADAESESETEILAARSDISADILKVGHHGSITSTTRSFAQSVSPQYAVISCGADNDYGHPSNRVLSLLDDLDAYVLRTDMDGTIVFVCDGENIIYVAY